MSKSKLGFNGTWSMAVGGMVRGGIFSTLGVVVGIAGAWAWLSFVAAGLIALTAGYSYVKLSAHYGEGGGAFTFLRKINARGFRRQPRVGSHHQLRAHKCGVCFHLRVVLGTL